MTTKQRTTKGRLIEGHATVKHVGTSACYGGPGETPYVILELCDRSEWHWFTTDESILQLKVGEDVMVHAYGYANGNLRRVTLFTMDNDGNTTIYGMRK